jgi:proline- and glutamine-rich splicing factor
MSEMMRREQERRGEEEKRMSGRMAEREDNLRQRHQENSLFVQAQELNSMLDQQGRDRSHKFMAEILAG